MITQLETARLQFLDKKRVMDEECSKILSEVKLERKLLEEKESKLNAIIEEKVRIELKSLTESYSNRLVALETREKSLETREKSFEETSQKLIESEKKLGSYSQTLVAREKVLSSETSTLESKIDFTLMKTLLLSPCDRLFTYEIPNWDHRHGYYTEKFHSHRYTLVKLVQYNNFRRKIRYELKKMSMIILN